MFGGLATAALIAALDLINGTHTAKIGHRGREMKTIYVGNLPFSATEDELRDLFSQYGTVHSVKLISDRDTGRPRGFGFVEMSEEDAPAAIEATNGADMGGRSLRVNEARPREGGGGMGARRGPRSHRSR